MTAANSVAAITFVALSVGIGHHGIYVGDDRVIQFGGRIADKPGTTIEAFSVAEFEGDGEAHERVAPCQPVTGLRWWPFPSRLLGAG
jgi:hypothetical protein